MKTVANNRRARYDYEILDTIEAGIRLTGAEVKSCRAGNVHLGGSYVLLLGDAPIIRGMKIAKYAYASGSDDDEHVGRDRPLLLKKSELERLQTELNEKGVTVIPLEVRAGKYIKVLIGIGRGKKRFDKRQKKKEADIGRRLREGREI